MTERGRARLTRSASDLAIGPSAWSIEDGRLVIDIDEWTVPIPRRARGRIAVDLRTVFDETYPLDEAGAHQWRPLAPCAAVAVSFDKPDLSWTGRAYVDMNTGTVPLEASFSRWNWSREDDGQATRIHYDVTQRCGRSRHLSLRYCADGAIEKVTPGPLQRLPRTGWQVSRSARAPEGSTAKVCRTLEDTPFYSRSMLGFDGGRGSAIHETVDLDRFRSPIVQAMLPFKMPRRAGG